ncbi:MAG: two-component sensor histidine kinase [Saccharospirillum sp.]|nr:two-component sensor histidine kinase [Saccharospirillum sp.]
MNVINSLPRSLFGRLLLIMLSGISLAQLLTSLIWAGQVNADSLQRIEKSSHYLAVSLSTTIGYFMALPANVRPIVIDQQREVGGTGLFISLNQSNLPVSPALAADHSELLLNTLREQLHEELGALTLSLSLAMPDAIRLYDRQIPIEDIPVRWVRQSLILEPEPAPILVAQVQLENERWLYLATLLPDPYLLSKNRVLTPERWWSLMATLVMAGLLSFYFVRWQTRPLRRLSAAADAFGRGLDGPEVSASGMRELDATAEAFSAMKLRIRRYLNDRERLFAAISHDLRTPVTRLRLQVELIDDEALKQSLEEDLDELDIMVKGALQTVRDSDIHEDPTAVDLDALLQRICNDQLRQGKDVRYHPETGATYIGKPLALKRAFTNLVDNAVQYGKSVSIGLKLSDDTVLISIADQGPGLTEDEVQRLLKPYTRLAHGQRCNADGMGLGLGIVQSIIHGHGGELSFRNLEQGGLEVLVALPAIYARSAGEEE